MKRDNQPWAAVEAAAIDWSDATVPRSASFGDLYYSSDNGPAESQHVFLAANGLPERWRQHSHDECFTIAESGFGTGLNFLLAWQAWRELQGPKPRLHYLSIEKHPLRHSDLALALGNWPQLQSLAQQLLQHYPGLLPGQHRIVLEQGRLVLDLWWEDIAQALPDLASHQQRWVDAWFLDGFAPAVNDTMWRSEHYYAMADLSRNGASFGTFTAAGHVRRGLEAAGFKVDKVPGYGRKRECLRGQLRQASARTPAAMTPWDLPAEQPSAAPRSALVIGAGLAGCHTAAALARRGLQVTLLDQSQLAGAGSGNDQGVLYTRLSKRHSALTDFALQSFSFASRQYQNMFRDGNLRQGLDGSLNGCFQQTEQIAEMSALTAPLQQVPELAQVLDAEQASVRLGVEQTAAGYWFPGSGWLHPAAVCRALLSSCDAELRENCGEIGLCYRDRQWQALQGHQVVATADIAVVAAGNGSAGFEPLSWLPLRAIRGQTTALASASPWNALQATLCHEGYIAPAREGQHCIGATFDIDDFDASPRSEDHRRNLGSLGRALPHWSSALSAIDARSLSGRVAYRCASPDYLPLAGPAPAMPAFLDDFAALRKNAKQRLPKRGSYLPGLYLNCAHGSRGLTSAPLTAELIASQICGEASPLSRELSRALAPARFLIRDLCKGRR